MKISLRPLLALVPVFFTGAMELRAETATFFAAKDNTLYQDETTALSNGAGEYLFVGRTNQTTDYLRRGLIQFDLSSIPPLSQITSVTLQLYLDFEPAASASSLISLHRTSVSWGEGTSDAGAQGGPGAPATANDATWLRRFNSGAFWTDPGGDFNPSPSASTSVGGSGSFFDWSGAGMIADIQSWVNNGASNHGWILIGDEETKKSAKRLSSRTNSLIATQPLLTVEYSSVPEPGSFALLAMATACLAATRIRRSRARADLTHSPSN